jgi:2-polyprenyl-3-methyl-5-hydroxy-6-metoxy-1,4-benzoquinol methylase
VSARQMEYDGERLVPGDRRLRNLLVEDLAKFHFASRYAADKLILDAGCGAGQGTVCLARSGARYTVGIDIASEAVTFARSHFVEPNLAFGRMDAAWLGFQDRTFDMVTSIEVIEHLSEPEHYVVGMRRVLKDDGMLVLSTPNKLISSPTPGTLWPHHIHEFYLEELEALLRRYFSEVEMWGMGIPVYDQHAVRRLMHWLAPIFKPILPLKFRTRALPTLQGLIKSDLTVDDVLISRQQVNKKSTLIAVCHV